jgi:hypothetical protein
MVKPPFGKESRSAAGIQYQVGINPCGLPQRRAVSADVVEALAQSVRDVGLINPITLRPREGLGFSLIAGRHRYEGGA